MKIEIEKEHNHSEMESWKRYLEWETKNLKKINKMNIERINREIEEEREYLTSNGISTPTNQISEKYVVN